MSVLNTGLAKTSASGYDIPNSLRFNDDSGAYLSKTKANGNRKKWTYSLWIKRGNLGTAVNLLNSSSSNNRGQHFNINSSDKISWLDYNDTTTRYLITTQVFRDTSAWYHIVIVWDSNNATADERMQLYVNGERVTAFDTENYPTQNEDSVFPSTTYGDFRIGFNEYTSGEKLDGYLAEVNFIDGHAKLPTDFGEFDATYGHWKAKKYTGTYSGNSFYLPFDNEGTKHTLTANGNVQHSTTQNKIGSSSMVFDGTGDYVSVSDPSDIKGLGDFTIECWVRPDATSFSGSRFIMGNGEGSDSAATIGFIQKGSDGKVYFHGYIGSTAYHPDYSNTVGVSVSTTAWTHVSAVRSGGTITVYKDGVSQGTISNSSAVNTPSSNAYSIGRLGSYNGLYYDGYLDEIRISNNARYTSSFTPSTTAFTDDDNTLLLVHSDTSNGSTTFTDSSGVTGALGNDQSGEANHWTTNNLTSDDQMLDSPTNNFATLNPLAMDSDFNLSEGNTKLTTHNSSLYGVNSTIGMTSGKWYAEFVPTSFPSSNMDVGLFAANSGSPLSVGVDDGANSISMRIGSSSGSVRQNNSQVVSTGLSFTAGSTVLRIAFDMGAGKVWFGTSSGWYNSGDPENGTNPTYSSNLTDDLYYFNMSDASSGNSFAGLFNFGQDSSFAGNKTAQGNTDSGGIGDFYYEPPTGYLALCIKNLADPAAGLWSGGDNQAFNTVTWTGDDSSNREITGVGFSPDLTWIKSRSVSQSHYLYDDIRGAGNYLQSDGTGYETSASFFNSFDDDGFTISGAGGNLSPYTYVAWNWKAGGDDVLNEVGDIPSQVSANVDAGFSIVSWTDDGTFTGTEGHGLNKTPELYIVKNRESTENWNTYTTVIDGSLDLMQLNLTNAKSNSGAGVPTSTTIQFGDSLGNDMIAYCFHSVDGYSKVGSYTANSSTDGPFVYTGFKPAYVMCKAAGDDSGYTSWTIHDSARNPSNEIAGNALYADRSYAEGKRGNNSSSSIHPSIDFLSNGFKIRTNGSEINSSNKDPYIYIAFAEHPFKYSTAR